MSRLPARFAAGALALVAALALAGPAVAAPIAPAGSDPLGLPRRPAAWALAGLPASGLGADASLGAFALGVEISGLSPGALRPEVHARLPLSFGPLVLAPRLAVGYSWALNDRFFGAPADSTLEAAPGIALGYRDQRMSVHLDLGALVRSNLERKEQTRLSGTSALGALYRVGDALAVGGWAGVLFSALRTAPAGGLVVAFTSK